MSIEDFRGQGPPGDIGQFIFPGQVMIFHYTFSGTVYTCAMRSGERGWVLVSYLPETSVNNSTVFDVAIATLPVGGGTIWVASELFLLKSTVTLLDNCVLKSTLLGNELRADAGFIGTQIIEMGDFTRCEGIYVNGDGHKVAQGFSCPGINITLFYCAVQGCDIGVYVNQSNIFILTCWIEGNYVGVQIRNKEHSKIVACIFVNNTSGAAVPKGDVYITGGAACIRQTIIGNSSETSWCFINVQGACSDSDFNDNDIYASDGAAFIINGNLSNTRINDNTFDGANYTPYFLQSLGGVTVTNVMCSDNSVRQWATSCFSEAATGRVMKFDNYTYNPVGVIANPYPVAAGDLDDVAAAQAFPTSNTNYTVVGSPKLITIYGGTVTSISIGGTVTGLTSGVFYLKPSQVLNVVWTGQPSSVVFAQ